MVGVVGSSPIAPTNFPVFIQSVIIFALAMGQKMGRIFYGALHLPFHARCPDNHGASDAEHVGEVEGV